MKIITEETHQELLENRTAHIFEMTFKRSVNVNGEEKQIHKVYLPLSEYPEIVAEGIEEIAIEEGALDDGHICYIATVETKIATYLFEYLPLCPPLCGKADRIEYVKSLKAAK